MLVDDAFSTSYALARAKFLDASAAARMRIESHAHPLLGRDGEPLAMDVALDGAADADKLLIVSSGCHGVEGYCGSGVQVFALHDREWLAAARSRGIALLFVHALNPYGFSHIRRFTHENIDLNRNCHDFSKPLPSNAGYRDLHLLLVAREWPPTGDNQRLIADYIEKHGIKAFQASGSSGQYEFADGLFYGGVAPTWSNLTWRQVLREHGGNAKRLGWIDLHTGLGPSGHCERVLAGKDDAVTLARARRWWGDVNSMYDGSSVSANLSGTVWNTVYDECPQAEVTSVGLEYGTLPLLDVMQALRAEMWLHNHPDTPDIQAKAIKRQLMDAFCVDTAAWRDQVVGQAREVLFQAIEGLCLI